MSRWICIALLLPVLTAHAAAQTTTVTFSDFPLSPGSYYNGGPTTNSDGFTNRGATFSNSFDSSYGGFSGWAVSNVMEMTTPGFMNQYAAYSAATGGSGALPPLGDVGSGTGNYAVMFGFGTIDLAAGYRPDSLQVTNTTYSTLAIRDGNDGNEVPFGKKFGGVSGTDPDWFLLTIEGLKGSGQSTGIVNFYLADYRFSSDYVVTDWTSIDLSSLTAETTKLNFSLSSSDTTGGWMNNPAYFAMDNFVMSAVPEPATVGLMGAAGLGLWRVIRRRVK